MGLLEEVDIICGQGSACSLVRLICFPALFGDAKDVENHDLLTAGVKADSTSRHKIRSAARKNESDILFFLFRPSTWRSKQVGELQGGPRKGPLSSPLAFGHLAAVPTNTYVL